MTTEKKATKAPENPRPRDAYVDWEDGTVRAWNGQGWLEIFRLPNLFQIADEYRGMGLHGGGVSLNPNITRQRQDYANVLQLQMALVYLAHVKVIARERTPRELERWVSGCLSQMSQIYKGVIETGRVPEKTSSERADPFLREQIERLVAKPAGSRVMDPGLGSPLFPRRGMGEEIDEAVAGLRGELSGAELISGVRDAVREIVEAHGVSDFLDVLVGGTGDGDSPVTVTVQTRPPNYAIFCGETAAEVAGDLRACEPPRPGGSVGESLPGLRDIVEKHDGESIESDDVLGEIWAVLREAGIPASAAEVRLAQGGGIGVEVVYNNCHVVLWSPGCENPFWDGD